MKTDHQQTAALDLVPETAPRSAALAHVPAQDPVARAIAEMMTKGMTTDNVAALEKLSDLYLKLQQNDAEKQFAAAFNALQAEMPAVRAMSIVNNSAEKGGGVRYKFAPYEAIMEQVRPMILKHGFTITFSSDSQEGRVIQHCTLQHIAGHKRTNSFAARIGRGPPGASETQGDGAASTYAKRFALCDALNIVIEKDGDARTEGAVIAPDKAQYLREQVAETRSDEKMFLALAGAKTYEEIREDKYDVLVQALAKKAKVRANQ